MTALSVYIGLGSNLDDPVRHLSTALRELAEMEGVSFVASSRLYRSKPFGPVDQPDYINAVCALKSGLPAITLLDRLQAIESRHGRIRSGERWGPRTLDLDLLLYGSEIIHSERLVVPHPWMCERAFVILPLQEIAPDLTFPDGTTVAECAGRFDAADLKPL